MGKWLVPVGFFLCCAACADPSLGTVRASPDSAVPGSDAAEPDTAVIDGLPVPHRCASDSEVEYVEEVVPPAQLDADSIHDVVLIIANCGPQAWRTATEVDAAQGVKLGSETHGETWGPGRILLGADVPPNFAVRLEFTVTAPSIAGAYPYQWQVVDEWVRWIGAPTPLRTIEVIGGAAPPPRPRSEWELASEPVDGPAMDLSAVEYITIHYPGGTIDVDGPDDEYQDEDMIAHLRSAHHAYERDRGYSYGYNSVIAPDGAEWLVRGNDIRAASNGCTSVNRAAYTIQVLLPTVEASPNPTQVEGVRRAVARVRLMVAAAGNGNFLALNGHRDVRPMCGTGGTACPGEALYSLLTSGAFEPDP